MPIPTNDDSILDAAILGRVSGLLPKHAIGRLARSSRTDRAAILQSVVQGDYPVTLRYRAALGLSLTDEGRPALLDCLGTTERHVRVAVLLGLSRVALPGDLGRIRAAAAELSGKDAERARFAELLIAHRHDLPFEAVPPHPMPPLATPGLTTFSMSIGTATEVAEAWRRATVSAHLGFDPEPSSAHVLHVGGCHVFVLPSATLTASTLVELSRVRSVLGGTFSQDRETASWYHDLWILSSPAPAGLEIQVWSLGGRLFYGGLASLAGEIAFFTLGTVATTGLAPVHVRGQLSAGRLAIEGVVDLSGSSKPPPERPLARQW